MAKKAAARKSTAKKSAKKATRRTARKRAARAQLVRVEFKPVHDAIDAALAQLYKRKPSIKRETLILKLNLMRNFKLCPKLGMFADLE